MAEAITLLWLFTPVFLFAGLMDPKIFTSVFRGVPSRKTITISFLVVFFCLLFLIGATPNNSKEQPQKLTATGQTKQVITPTQEITLSPTRAELSPSQSPSSTLPPSPIATGEYLVTRVIDGDTIEIEGGKRVRYIGIDTPEITSTDCYGAEATRRNKELVLGKRVDLEKDVSETDRYGRLLRYVYVMAEKGTRIEVNKTLVQEGYAQASTYPPDISHQIEFKNAEQQARDRGGGLWGKCGASTQSEEVASTTKQAITTTDNTSTSQGGCVIKGNINSDDEKIFHVPGCQSYVKTVIDTGAGERWFCTEEEATGAGWRKAKNCP